MSINVPKDCKWLRDQTGKMLDPESISFANNQEMTDVMKMPEYNTDPTLRLVVSKMIENGLRDEAAAKAAASATTPVNHVLETAMSDRASARRLDDDAIFREQSQAMFGDPRYATSPTYRREVENWLRDNTPMIDAAMPKGSLIDRNLTKGATRVVFGDGSAEASRKIIADKRAANEKAELQEKHDRVDRGESSDVFDLGGKKS
jgi:hypothetical protein